MTLQINSTALDFTLTSTKGDNFRLFDYVGENHKHKVSSVILYFYPKDNTPGCTMEANDFAKYSSKFDSLGSIIIGVSADTLESHNQFKNECELPFELLVDSENKVAKLYEVYGEKKVFGSVKLGIIRSTFIIDSSGKIAKIWSPVKVQGHAEEVYSSLNTLLQN